MNKFRLLSLGKISFDTEILKAHNKIVLKNYMPAFLKTFTWLCKIAAIVFCFYGALAGIELDIADLHGNGGHWRDPRPDDWGTSAFKLRTYLEIAELITLAVLAILPNRWLVFSRTVFAVSLLIALIPFYQFGRLTEWQSLLFDLLFLAPLPLCLILSFWQHQKGEKIRYV